MLMIEKGLGEMGTARRGCGLGSVRRIGVIVGEETVPARCIASVLLTFWMELGFFFGSTERRLVHLDIILDRGGWWLTNSSALPPLHSQLLSWHSKYNTPHYYRQEYSCIWS